MKLLYKLTLTLFIMTSLHPSLHASQRDITLLRAGLFASLGSYVYFFMQEESSFDAPLRVDFSSPSLLLSQGKEFNPQEQRYLANTQLSLSVPWRVTIKRPYFTLSVATELNVNRWYSTHQNTLNEEGFIYSLTPILTYTFDRIEIGQSHPYIEMGSGLALMDSKTVENRDKASHFQFVDSLGFGVSFENYKIGYRFTHTSNLGLAKPNPSMDLHQIQIGYRF